MTLGLSVDTGEPSCVITFFSFAVDASHFSCSALAGS